LRKKIFYALAIIDEIQNNYQSDRPIKELRIVAIKKIAEQAKITLQSVSDPFIRWFRPEIKNMRAFDEELEFFFIHGSERLFKILLKYAHDEFGYNYTDNIFKEGKMKFRLHLTKERNPSLVKQVKEKWRKANNGDVHCLACDFSFQKYYGNIGMGYIEAHHLKPISTISPDTITCFSDLVPVCSNCHRMLHHNIEKVSIEYLCEYLTKHKKYSQ
jgi:hypothetical protein